MRELLKFLHWGPFAAVFVVKCISLTTLYFTSIWFPASDSWLAFLNHLVFLSFVGTTLYNLFCAILIGPGYLPLKWTPKDKEACRQLQYCNICEGYKAPRSHHCRKCERCVLKMDHHCPWINNCCGHRNHLYFTCFVLFSVAGTLQASVLLVIAIYRGYYASWYFYHGDRNKVVYMTVTSFLFCVFSLSLAIGAIIAVGGLLLVQIKIILRNRTSIEEWIVVKAESRERNDVFRYPYDLGRWENFKQVFFKEPGDGIVWPVAEGCDQYTLTREQLEQKEEKRVRSRNYQAISCYSGAWFPLISQGFKTCIKFPFNDEPRIPLDVGDVVTVTRWKTYWLYGVKFSQKEKRRLRGWFPKRCVVEVTDASVNKKLFNSHLQPSRCFKED